MPPRWGIGFLKKKIPYLQFEDTIAGPNEPQFFFFKNLPKSVQILAHHVEIVDIEWLVGCSGVREMTQCNQGVFVATTPRPTEIVMADAKIHEKCRNV